MNYKRAKIEAQSKANNSNLDYAILFNGNEYNVTIAKKHKGDVFEIVKPDLEEIKESKKSKKKAISNDIPESEIL